MGRDWIASAAESFCACPAPRGQEAHAIRSAPVLILLLAALLALAPISSAGTVDAPELTDAADDCAFAPGNHYGDVTAAWISGETATGFDVNLQLSKWTVDALGAFSGYTVQFQHQGVQYGVAAFFFGTGWDYSTAYIDLDSGEMTGFESTTGTFTPGTPALITIYFDKALFPHGDAADNKLVAFEAASADFKTSIPWGGPSPVPIPVPPPNGGFMVCDIAEGTGTYTFQVGGHSMHGTGATPSNATEPASGASDAAAGSASGANATDDEDVTPASTTDDSKNKVPGAGALGAILACVGAAVLARPRGH